MLTLTLRLSVIKDPGARSLFVTNAAPPVRERDGPCFPPSPKTFRSDIVPSLSTTNILDDAFVRVDHCAAIDVKEWTGCILRPALRVRPAERGSPC